eukprot:g287.t1
MVATSKSARNPIHQQGDGDGSAAMRSDGDVGRDRGKDGLDCFIPVDFVFDRNQSNSLTITFMTLNIFVFFAFIVTGASRDVTVMVNCSGVPSSLLKYLIALLVVPIMSPIVLINSPLTKNSSRHRVKALTGVALCFLVLAHIAYFRLALSTRHVSWDCTYNRTAARANGVPPVDRVIFNSLGHCIPAFMGGNIGDDLGPKSLRAGLLDATGWDRSRCEAQNATWTEHDQILYLGYGKPEVPLAAVSVLLFLLDVAFLSLVLRQHRRAVTAARSPSASKDSVHTKTLLKSGRVRAQPPAAAAAAYGLGNSTGLASGKGGGQGRSAGTARPLGSLSRGALLVELMDRLTPLFDHADDEERLLLQDVAVAAQAHIERGRRERQEREQAVAEAATQAAQAQAAPEQLSWRKFCRPCRRWQRPATQKRDTPSLRQWLARSGADKGGGEGQDAGQPPEESHDSDSLRSLPTVVFVASVVGIVTLVFIFQVALSVTPGIGRAVDGATGGLATTAGALSNITDFLLPVVPSLCTGSVTDSQSALAEQALAKIDAAAQVGNTTWLPEPMRKGLVHTLVYLLGTDASGTSGTVGSGTLIGKEQVLVQACQSLRPLQGAVEQLARSSTQIDAVSGLLTSLGGAIPAAWVVGNVCAFSVIAGLGVCAPLRYREVQRMLRAGAASSMGQHRPWMPAKYKVALANKYIGLHLGSAVFGYTILMFLLVAVFTVLFSADFWTGLATAAGGLAPASLVLTVLQLVLDSYIGNRRLSDGYWIYRPKAWAWFSSTGALPSVITGIVGSIKRFAYLLLISLASVATLDSTNFPPELAGMDQGYNAFMAVAIMQHRHRSPVLTTARDKIFGQNGRHTQRGSLGKSNLSAAGLRARTRWQLAYTLLNNPALLQLRGHGIDARLGPGAEGEGAGVGAGAGAGVGTAAGAGAQGGRNVRGAGRDKLTL